MSPIRTHGGTYRGHRVRMKMRNGEIVYGRFERNNNRAVWIRLACGTIRKILQCDLRTFAIAHKGMGENDGEST